MMFKDAIILKKEVLEKTTIERGMEAFTNLMQAALDRLMSSGGQLNTQILNDVMN